MKKIAYEIVYTINFYITNICLFMGIVITWDDT